MHQFILSLLVLEMGCLDINSCISPIKQLLNLLRREYLRTLVLPRDTHMLWSLGSSLQVL